MNHRAKLAQLPLDVRGSLAKPTIHFRILPITLGTVRYILIGILSFYVHKVKLNLETYREQSTLDTDIVKGVIIVIASQNIQSTNETKDHFFCVHKPNIFDEMAFFRKRIHEEREVKYVVANMALC
ncbi:Hypothetical predicted protein [Octopus vulgaris]|uniref:Uncharacterized protein n=1 Tax=Octopus vulgaris TaxID=6645 RepID=A0AA36APL4_OCTVU|nr:Hypothetical predicted protein [Octopus vulgaris]